MATTVISAMDAFLANIQPTSNQISEASTSHNALRKYLRESLTVSTDFLTGSYSRNTMIRQSRDIDLFLVLDSSYYSGRTGWIGYRDRANGPANLLDYLKQLLQKKYTSTEIGRDGQAVRVEFSHVHIDVVPAFKLTSGGYYIPNTPTNSWLTSDPGKHNDAITTGNQNGKIRGRLVPLAKMVKYWNHSHNYGRKGFFLEMLARDIFQYWSASSYADAVYTYFSTGLDYITKSYAVTDPGTGKDLMGEYMLTQTRKDSAISNFTTARDLAVAAINANNSGDNKTAIEKWQRLFGAEFPRYG